MLYNNGFLPHTNVLTAAITQTCREMAGLSVIKEIGKSRMTVDENDVQIVQAALTNWGNPFSSS